MLDINIEFSKGVLFVKLSGDMTKDNSKNVENNLKSILIKSGIKYLVINTKDLNIIEEVDLFNNCESIISNNNGKMILCSNKKTRYETASNELVALRMIHAC